jgi:nucleoside-diphosphate-sugar epimerase
VAGRYKVGEHDAAPFEAVNVVGTRNVLEVMAELEIPRGVYTSTLAVNSDTQRMSLMSWNFGEDLRDG